MASLKHVKHSDIIYAFFQLTLVQYSFHLFESSIHKNVKYKKTLQKTVIKYLCNFCLVVCLFFWFNFVCLFFYNTTILIKMPWHRKDLHHISVTWKNRCCGLLITLQKSMIEDHGENELYKHSFHKESLLYHLWITYIF